MKESANLPPILERLQAPALAVGLCGLGACALGLGREPPHQFYLSYLFAYLFWVGLPLGALGLLMLQHVTGGGWGLVIRRPLESGVRMLSLMAVLFLPLLFGLRELYAWTIDPQARGVGVSPLRPRYLSVDFFIFRSVIYFFIWLVLAYLLDRWSRAEDRTGDPRLGRRFQLLSGAGLVLYGLTVTFAALDWAMSLSPEWYSTIYGALFMVGQGLGTLALMIVVVALVAERKPLAGLITEDHFHDLGNLLLAFVMLWAYLAFSQFLIIWSADLAEEIPHYLYRTQGGWKWIGLSLIVLHFFVPFLVLLSRGMKRRRKLLALVALGVLLLRPIDLYWLVVPGYAQGHRLSPIPGLRLHWLDLAAFGGMGGLWIGAFLGQLKRRPLVPLHDPRWKETRRHG